MSRNKQGSGWSYRFGIIAEVHLPSGGQPPAEWHNPLRFDLAPALLKRATRWCVDQGADSIVLLGDLTNTADLAAFDSVLETVTSSGLPVVALPGNHDVVHDKTGLPRYREAVARAGVVAAPTAIRLDDGIQVIGLGLEWDEDHARFRSVHPPEHPGNDQELLIVLSHYPLLPMVDDLAAAGLKHAGDLIDRDDCAAGFLRSREPVLVVHGHLHVHAAMISGTMLHLSTAALIEPPHSAAVVTITRDDGGILVERSALSLHESAVDRMPITSPMRAAWRWSGDGWSQVDFDASLNSPAWLDETRTTS